MTRVAPICEPGRPIPFPRRAQPHMQVGLLGWVRFLLFLLRHESSDRLTPAAAGTLLDHLAGHWQGTYVQLRTTLATMGAPTHVPAD